MQMISQNRRVKSIDQPLSPFVATAAQMEYLPNIGGGQYIYLDAYSRDRIHAYLESILAGEIHIQEPWRFWRRDFHFRTNRLVLKTTNAHYLGSMFVEDFSLHTIRYFRPPIPQALSCIGRGWEDQLVYFADSNHLQNELFSHSQKKKFDQIIADGTTLERHVLGWCCENLPLLGKAAGGVMTISYENLVLHPGETASQIAEYCNLSDVPAMVSMVGEASFSSQEEKNDTSVNWAIKAGKQDFLLSRWQQKVTTGEIAQCQSILDAFEVTYYSADDPLGTIRLLKGERPK
ncbi:MAG: hypothetical protein COC24_018070 [Alphaproteobacteria bacterium]|nr:hypothetical protein [Alphaproteobacteria bacterium]